MQRQTQCNLVELLGIRGRLALSMPSYEQREGQLAMAQAVQTCLQYSEILLCEAGTGIGKTLAYLVPVILSDQKAVISTATIALQEQIIHQDLPTIKTHLQLNPKVVIVKGLSNYLCLRRFWAFRKSPDADIPRARSLVARIDDWLKTTETGDVSELSMMTDRSAIWQQVCASSETRIGPKCPFFNDCFVTKMRRRADASQIVVANHHLVFADAALRRGSRDRAGVLPPYEAIVFDEAHQIEDIASEFFGIRVSTARIQRLLKDALAAFRFSLPAAAAHVCSHQFDHEQLLVKAVSDTCQQLFDTLARRYQTSTDCSKTKLSSDSWIEPIATMYYRLDAAMEALQRFTENQRNNEALQMIHMRAVDLRNDLARVVDAETDVITWIEKQQRSVAIGATPLRVGPMLCSHVFEKVPAVILTSATLTSSSGFSFFRSRVGVDLDPCKTRELQVLSPFNYEQNALLYTPTDLPDPADRNYSLAVGQRAAELVQLTDGGALVLCTSYRAMRLVAQVLRQAVCNEVLVQGQGAKTALVHKFCENKRAVLVATMSFWQGIDIAGQALRLVIIDKLPFAVPTDPVVMARCSALEEQGEDAFRNYLLPRAAITLKQGFGRLIRTQKDRGIVAVLDKRIVQKNYGKSLLKVLPPASIALHFSDVLQFWNRVSTL